MLLCIFVYRFWYGHIFSLVLDTHELALLPRVLALAELLDPMVILLLHIAHKNCVSECVYVCVFRVCKVVSGGVMDCF